MTPLLVVELTRFVSRRSVRVFGMFLLLAVIAAGSLTFALSNRDEAGATARARAAATQEHQACLRGEFGPPSDGGVKELCPEPDLTQITADPRFHLAKLRDVFGGVGAALVLLGLGLGASGIGAEWHHRTMTTLLTWEARRMRVAVAKLAASAGVVFVGVIVFEALLGAALVPAAVFRGTTSGATVSWLAGVIGVVVRGAALGAMAAVIGGTIALVARNSALALGISFAWFAVVENMIRGLRPRWQPWLIGDNAESFIAPSISTPRSALGGGLVLGFYVSAAALVAIRIFRARDVA